MPGRHAWHGRYPSRVLPTDPPPDARDAWPSYAAIAAVGYVVYGVGAVAPYLRTQLGLSDAQVGLHSSAMAIGLVLSGVIAAALDRRFGEVTVRGAGVAILAVAVVVLALGPALAATLGAALLVGLGAGTLLGYANALLGRPGGRLARLRVARANVWAMVSAFVCPVVLAAASGHGSAVGARAPPGARSARHRRARPACRSSPGARVRDERTAPGCRPGSGWPGSSSSR